MRYKHNRSKIITMRRSQEGMASIVIVTVLVVIITMISLGFARIMSRSVANSSNRQFSAAATYAAQSAINDVASYIKLAGNSQAYSDKCNGSGSLIGDSTSKGPFYYASSLTGDKSSRYTCLLLDQTPTDLIYQQVANNKSRVVKMTTSAFQGSLNKMMLSWQPSNSQITGFPASASTLYDETTWNDPSKNYVPVLRVTLYPVPLSGLLDKVQERSKTVFLYPQHTVGNVTKLAYDTIADGGIVPVRCVDKNAGETATVGSTSGVSDFSGSADYTCNIIFDKLTLGMKPDSDQVDFYYLRITPIYNQADIKIKANDMWDQVVKFKNVQAMVDATATAGTATKRLQARVDISSVSNNPAGEDSNISSNSDSIPEASVRTANALCKRVIQTQSVFNYVSFDEPSAVCHDTDGGSSVAYGPQTLTMNITGSNGPDAGKVIDSEKDTPTSANRGVSYINAGGSAVLNWQSDNSTDCIGTGSGWSGSQKPSMNFSGTAGTGSRTFNNINTVTTWSLQCTRVGGVQNGDNAASTTLTSPTRTVTAWPPPSVGLSYSGPIQAGSSGTISWSSANSTSCNLSGGSWQNPNDHSTSNSQSYNAGLYDKSTRTFTVTCYDPIGRSATDTKTMCTSGCDFGNPPPSCHSTPDVNDNGDGTASVRWDAACPDQDPNGPFSSYVGYSNSDPSFTVPGYGSGIPSSSGWINIGYRGGQTFCFSVRAFDSNWGTTVDNQSCRTISYPPVNIIDFRADGPWYQFPQCHSPGNWWDSRWDCGGSGDPKVYNPGTCYDEWHEMTVCSSNWSSSQTGSSYSDITCTLTSNGTFLKSSGASDGTGHIGWNNSSPELTITCVGKGGMSATRTIY
ncbi:MAG: hypothetical protein JWO96_158 [Candidatus Saccharibacteria bacterium]|nr:hypothetical protein [Candidatus Saccharibacteria bacterium]